MIPESRLAGESEQCSLLSRLTIARHPAGRPAHLDAFGHCPRTRTERGSVTRNICEWDGVWHPSLGRGVPARLPVKDPRSAGRVKMRSPPSSLDCNLVTFPAARYDNAPL